MTADTALELRSLSLNYHMVRALDDISLTVANGEFVALLGPSGCGKTSLLRSIAGFSHPQRGAIFIRGKDVVALPARQRNIGMVFQSYALFPHLTAEQNVQFGLRCRRVPAHDARARVAEMLKIVGLQAMAARRPVQLSGGQQQRVALARALVIQPDLLLLDEALGALDRKLRVEMQTELKSIQRRFGIATIFVTHDQEEAMAMADRIAVMRDGRIEQLDVPRGLFHAPRTAWVAEFMGAGNLLSGRVLRNGGEQRLELPPGCEFAVAGTAAGQSLVTAYVRADRVRLEPASAGESAVEIVAQRFLGAQVELHARAPGTQLRILLPFEQADGFHMGQFVRVGATSADCRILTDG